MSWLWFLPALFIDSVLNYPILRWTQRRYKEEPITLKDDGLTIGGLGLLLVMWVGFQQVLVGDSRSGREDVYIMTGIMVLVYAAYFTLPHWLVKRENGYKYALLLKLIGPVACVAMNFVKDGDNETTQYGFLLQLNFDLVFMCQGLVDQTYWREMAQARKELAETMWTIFAMWNFFFYYSLTSPTSITGQGYLFYYPIYKSASLRCFFILGTWMWLYLLCYHLSVVANSKFSDKWYDLIVGSSMYVYVSHYFWLAIISRAVLYFADFGFAGNVAFAFVFTQLLLLLSHLSIEKLASLCSKKKDQDGSEPKGEVEVQKVASTDIQNLSLIHI